MSTLGRVGVYLRCSTADQSTDSQRNAILEYLKARSCDSVELYNDEGRSGTTMKHRPALKQLLEDCKRRKIDTIVVYKLDRCFRSLKDCILTLQDLSDWGVSFVSLNDPIDLSSSSGRLMLQIIGAFAEFEAALIRERTIAGLHAAKARGKRLGRAPTVDRAPILDLYSKGTSLRQIARQLGVPLTSVHRAVKERVP